MASFSLENEKEKCQYGDHCERREKDICIGNKGFRTVVVDDFFGVREHGLTDKRTDDTGNEHLREDAHALEHARFADGCEVTDLCTEDRHAREIAAHHEERACEYECGCAEEEQ